MIGRNIVGFESLAHDKKVSDLYLGSMKVNWEFLKVHYSALCTEAMPLTFLEQMICGIADLDEIVDIKVLAEVMGFNFEDNPQMLKFQDKAEVEILMETLRTLHQYGMIISPDDSFSSIELSSIGKEYFSQNRKIKHGEQKNFTMYFDLMGDSHNEARDLFSKVVIDGSLLDKEVSVPYSDESFVKNFAENQIPQYYSSESGNSFTELSVSTKEILYKEVVLGVLYDTFTEKYRFVVLDSGGIDREYIEKTANSDIKQSELLEKFFKNKTQTSNEKSQEQIAYEEEIIKIQRDAEYEIFNGCPDKAIKLVSEYASSPSFMEIENLFLFANSKKESCHDLFLCVPELSEESISKVVDLSNNSTSQIMLLSSSTTDISNSFGDNVLVLQDDEYTSPAIIVDGLSYCCHDLVFTYEGKNYIFNFFKKQDDASAKSIEEIRYLFANKLLPSEFTQYVTVLAKESFTDIPSRVSELNSADKLVHFTDEEVERSGLRNELVSLRTARDEALLQLIQDHSRNLLEEIEYLKANTVIDKIDSLNDMDKVKADLCAVKEKFLKEQSNDQTTFYGSNGFVIALWNTYDTFMTRLDEREKYLRQEILPKSFVFDTNVFVLFPQIMDYISKDDRIVLSLKLLEELDKLKGKTKGKEKKRVQDAIKEINHKIKMKAQNLYFEEPVTRLLPEGYDKKNPDNMILSAALKLFDKNPFIITNDVNFQNKAAGLGIPFKSLKDILPIEVYDKIELTKANEISRRNDQVSDTFENEATNKRQVRMIDSSREVAPKKNLVRQLNLYQLKDGNKRVDRMPADLEKLIIQAYNSLFEQSKEVLVAMIVQKMKEISAEFDLKTYGYLKFKDLCAAYPSQIELYENKSNALCIKLLLPNNKKRFSEECRNESAEGTQHIILEEIIRRMITEEDHSDPVKDGEIRKEYIALTKRQIKLDVIRQAREQLGYPTRNIRLDHYQNNN